MVPRGFIDITKDFTRNKLPDHTPRGFATFLDKLTYHPKHFLGVRSIGSQMDSFLDLKGVQPIRSEAYDPGEAGKITVLLPFKNARRCMWA